MAEGQTTSPEILFEIAKDLGIHEIVVPDIMGDCDGTIAAARDFQKYVQPQYQYMGVAQGKSMAEVLKCATALDSLGFITTLGLPRVINRTIHKTFRFTLLDSLLSREVFGFRWYHCLGASEWVREVAALAELGNPRLRGMDSSLPAVLGCMERDIKDAEYVHRTSDFFGTVPTPFQMRTTYDNCRTFCEWAGQASPLSEL